MTEEQILSALRNQERKFKRRMKDATLFAYIYYAFDFLKFIRGYLGISPALDEQITLYRTMIYDIATYKVGALGLCPGDANRLLKDVFAYLDEASLEQENIVDKGRRNG